MKTSRSPHRILISLLAFVGMFFSIGTLVPSAAADNLIENFPVGPSPYGMAFDGANIWVGTELQTLSRNYVLAMAQR